MSTEQQPVDPNAVEETKQQIRGLVNEIAQLSRQELDPSVFYGEFLQRVITALAAVGGAVWIRGESSTGLELKYQINLRQSFPEDESGESHARHARLLHRVVRDGEELLVPPYSGAPGDDEAGNPTAFLLVLSPIRDDKDIAGVIEIFQRPSSGPASQRGYLRFLNQMCEHVGDFLKARRLRQLTDWQSLFTQVDRFSRLVHEGLDPKTTAYTIANEGRRLIGCDRVSVGIRRGNRCKIEAVSGQDTMDMRANAITLLSKLATAVMRSGEPLWYTGSTHDLPPQIEGAVQNYVDETHTKSVAVLPLRRQAEDIDEQDDKKRAAELDEGEVIAALVVEQIEDNRPPEAFAQGVELVSEHSSRALSNSLEHNDLFLMPVWREIGKWKWILRARTLPKTIAAMTALVAVILFLCFFPARFEMVAKGKVWPEDRRDVFVVEDGMVSEVYVKHGDQVEAGTELVQLRNPDLINELTRVSGALEQAIAQYRQLNRSLDNTRNPADRASLEGQINELKVQILSNRDQIRQLEKRRDALTIRSPIAGQVVTFRVDYLLDNRPLRRGEVPLTIVNQNSDWELDLYMEESKMGHVRSSLPDDGIYTMRYILKSDPRNQHEGTVGVEDIHNRAELTEEHGNAIHLIGHANDQAALGGVLPGTEVTAKIYCGKRPIGYKWFHQLIEWIQTHLLF